MVAITSAIDRFLADLHADLRFVEGAESMARALRALDLEGDGSTDALELLAAIDWIVGQPRTIDEKCMALDKLMDLKLPVPIPRLRGILGWPAN